MLLCRALYLSRLMNERYPDYIYLLVYCASSNPQVCRQRFVHDALQRFCYVPEPRALHSSVDICSKYIQDFEHSGRDTVIPPGKQAIPSESHLKFGWAGLVLV